MERVFVTLRLGYDISADYQCKVMQLLGDKSVVCVYLTVCVCIRLRACWWCLYSLTARLQTVYRLVLAWSCMCLRWDCLTNPVYKPFLLHWAFFKLPINYSSQIRVVAQSWMRSNKLAGTCLSCCRICSVRRIIWSPSHLSAHNTGERIHPERNTRVDTTIAE